MKKHVIMEHQQVISGMTELFRAAVNKPGNMVTGIYTIVIIL
jgi:hypothetical protein